MRKHQRFFPSLNFWDISFWHIGVWPLNAPQHVIPKKWFFINLWRSTKCQNVLFYVASADWVFCESKKENSTCAPSVGSSYQMLVVHSSSLHTAWIIEVFSHSGMVFPWCGQRRFGHRCYRAPRPSKVDADEIWRLTALCHAPAICCDQFLHKHVMLTTWPPSVHEQLLSGFAVQYWLWVCVCVCVCPHLFILHHRYQTERASKG